MNASLAAAVEAAIGTSQIPDVVWMHGDDLCDCTFQRIGMWTNPYIARTLKVRFCCIWERLYEEYPEYVQRIPGFLDYNASSEDEADPSEVYELTPRKWDADHQMPRSMWYRQIQAVTGEDMAVIREEFANATPPGPRLPANFWLPGRA